MYSVLQPLDASFAILIEFVNDTEASPASIDFLNPLAFSFELNIVGLEERRLKQSSMGSCGSHPPASRWSQSEGRRIGIDWRHQSASKLDVAQLFARISNHNLSSLFPVFRMQHYLSGTDGATQSAWSLYGQDS